VDRLIQQTVAQVLGPVFDPRFSENSYGCGASEKNTTQQNNHITGKLFNHR